MSNVLSTPSIRIKTFFLLALCGLLTIAAAAIGMDDNPPGVLLAYLAATAFVLAFVHPWRSTRPFMFLLFASVIGLVLFIVLNNLFAAVAHDPGTVGTFQKLMQGLAVAAFFLGTLIFPVAFIIGVVGAVVMFIRNRRRPT